MLWEPRTLLLTLHQVPVPQEPNLDVQCFRSPYSFQGSPKNPGVAISFSRGSSCPGIESGSPALAGRFFTIWSHQRSPLIMDRATEMQDRAQFNPRWKNISYSFFFPWLISPVSTIAPMSLSHWFRTPPSHTIPNHRHPPLHKNETKLNVVLSMLA